MSTIMITVMISERALRCQTVYSCGLAVALMLYRERQDRDSGTAWHTITVTLAWSRGQWCHGDIKFSVTVTVTVTDTPLCSDSATGRLVPRPVTVTATVSGQAGLRVGPGARVRVIVARSVRLGRHRDATRARADRDGHGHGARPPAGPPARPGPRLVGPRAARTGPAGRHGQFQVVTQ
jgi:hypothetical protein